MNQSKFLVITCNSLKAQEKSRVHGAIGFRFASHWLKNWRESFEPITKRSNRNHVITFDGHLKTALSSELTNQLIIILFTHSPYPLTPKTSRTQVVCPQGPHSHILMAGGGGVRQRFIFYTQKNPNFRICLPKKSLSVFASAVRCA